MSNFEAVRKLVLEQEEAERGRMTRMPQDTEEAIGYLDLDLDTLMEVHHRSKKALTEKEIYNLARIRDRLQSFIMAVSV